MKYEIEILLKSGTTAAQHQTIADAIAAWCTWASRFPLTRQMKLAVHGGPYLEPEQLLETWRAVLPAGLVEELVVEGEKHDG